MDWNRSRKSIEKKHLSTSVSATQSPAGLIALRTLVLSRFSGQVPSSISNLRGSGRKVPLQGTDSIFT
ncbi:unnamed protein product [Linum tenue]|uniref:Uncharacterized protein n=1 Tax=Linum tenue TaxID=586396 RepID=A0AAV0N4Q5_9ROSI|nr:unnamed protein product [Linum tenue]